MKRKVGKLKVVKLRTGKSKSGKPKSGSSKGGSSTGGPGAGGGRRSTVSKLSGPVVRAARRRVYSWRRMSSRRWPSPTRIRRRAAS